MSALRAFDTLIDVVLAVDSELCVRYGNGPASELLEVSVKRLASGKPLSQWIEISGDDFDVNAFALAKEPSPYRELAFTTPSGKSGWIQASAQPAPAEILPEGSGPLWLIYLRDVSLEKTLFEKYKSELDQKEVVIDDLRAAQAKLEDYSRNLEKMVEARTAELREANRALKAVLDSLAQGIAAFDRTGRLLPMHSRVARTLFEKDVGGVASAAELLGLDGAERASFERWREAAFEEMLPFEDMAPLGPSRYAHTKGRAIALDFNPMRSDSGTLDAVVMVATDRTDELTAIEEAKRERRLARMVTLVAGHRNQFRSFAREARSLFVRLEAAFATVVTDSDRVASDDELARWMHTVKGGAASFALDDVASQMHECESLLPQAQSVEAGERASARGRISTGLAAAREALERFLEERKELFGGIDASGRTAEIPVAKLSEWAKGLEGVPQAEKFRSAVVSEYVQIPIRDAFSHMVPAIAELAETLGKPVAPIRFVGGDLRVTPEPFAELFASFVHAFRNAVDHGLETAEQRRASGKSEQGSIEVKFERFERDESSWIRISVTDDGRGIDAARIRAKLDSKGHSDWYAGKSESEIIQAVFMDDLSTAEHTTETSGRGVGLSALLSEARALGGQAWVETSLGKGSCVTAEAPERSTVVNANVPGLKVVASRSG